MVAIDKLSPALRHILDMELATGNKIVEIATEPGWPPNCELFICLKRKFSKPYILTPEVAFTIVDDYHYWFSDYNFNSNQQILTCQFESPIPKFEQFLARIKNRFPH
jgi:hypothetical protein